MKVTRVRTEDGSSRVEPPFDQDWDERTQLHWKAAVVAHDTGIKVSVTVSEVTMDGQSVPGMFAIQVGGRSIAALDFRAAWNYLNGVAAGATVAFRETEGRKHD